MKINDDWVEVLPSMISRARRKGTRIPEFEELITQHPYSASEYASAVIRGKWEEAEDIILKEPDAALNYARNVLHARWETGEDIIATDANCSFNYARYVLKGRFDKGEVAIATSSNLSMSYAQNVLHGRFVLGEEAIAAVESSTGNPALTKQYYEYVVKDPSNWSSWDINQLKLSPCWMYMYAKEFVKGRLPDVLHNTMTVFGMTIPDNYYVKRYFKAKKYNKKINRRKPKTEQETI